MSDNSRKIFSRERVYVCQSGNSTHETFFVEEAKVTRTQAPRREIRINNLYINNDITLE